MRLASKLLALLGLVGCGSDGGGSNAPCATTDDCPPGEFCSAAEVCLLDGFCSVAADCADGQICVDDKCLEPGPCATDADCEGADTYCSAGGTCIPDGTCAVEGDCEDADYCSANDHCIPDGTCAVDADCTTGMVCDEASTCVPGSDCGATELVIEAVPPNLLIPLDRSCSMTAEIGGVTKWTSAVSAINTLTTDYDDRIRWGLGLFPDRVTPNCEQAAVVTIPNGPDNEVAIQTLLNNALVDTDTFFPDGPCVTNIDTAMEQAAAQVELTDPDRRSFIMLITDGKQAGCNGAGGDAGTEGIINDLFMNRGIITFVVGFGDETDQAQMNEFADLGGAPLTGPNRYYQADNQVELEMALDTIAGLVVSCDYAVTDPPDDIDDIYAFFEDTEQVPRDTTHMAGWDFDPATGLLTFYGSYCDRLQDFSVDDVDIVFGCPAPVLD